MFEVWAATCASFILTKKGYEMNDFEATPKS